MTTSQFTTFAQFNPITKPNWRSTRARWLARHCPRPSQRLDDEDTLRACRYFRALGRCGSNSERAKVRRDFPDLTVACRIHRRNGNVRLELECRVLAAQADYEIAETMSLPVPVVATYTKFFYDVRPYLDATDRIVMSVIGNKFVTAAGEPDIGVIGRQMSFFGGPAIVRTVLPRLLDGSALSNESLDLSKAANRSTARVRLAVQGMVMPNDSKTALELMKQWPSLLPFLNPLPKPLEWNGVLAERMTSLPESVLRHVVGQAMRHKERARESTQRQMTASLYQLETAEQLSEMALAVGVA